MIIPATGSALPAKMMWRKQLVLMCLPVTILCSASSTNPLPAAGASHGVLPCTANPGAQQAPHLTMIARASSVQMNEMSRRAENCSSTVTTPRSLSSSRVH